MQLYIVNNRDLDNLFRVKLKHEFHDKKEFVETTTRVNLIICHLSQSELVT